MDSSSPSKSVRFIAMASLTRNPVIAINKTSVEYGSLSSLAMAMDAGYGGLHVPEQARWGRTRRSNGPLLFRRGALRDGHRQTPVSSSVGAQTRPDQMLKASAGQTPICCKIRTDCSAGLGQSQAVTGGSR